MQRAFDFAVKGTGRETPDDAFWAFSRSAQVGRFLMAPAPQRRPSLTHAELLKRVRYFGSLSDSELRRLAGQCAPRTL